MVSEAAKEVGVLVDIILECEEVSKVVEEVGRATLLFLSLVSVAVNIVSLLMVVVVVTVLPNITAEEVDDIELEESIVSILEVVEVELGTFGGDLGV